MTRLVLSLVLVFASIFSGYAFRVHAENKRGISEASLCAMRNRLQVIAFFALLPLSSMISLWGLPSPTPRLMLLPFFGMGAWLLGGSLALFFAKLLKKSPDKAGSLFCCGTFSNIGAVGTLVCTVFLGEAAIALAAIYRLFEEIVFYGLVLPIARRFSLKATQSVTEDGGKKQFHFSAVLLAILAALLLGILLNLCDFSRPPVLAGLAAPLTLVATCLSLFAIGMGLRFSRLKGYATDAFCICLIKFFCVPAILVPLAVLAGFGTIDNGLPLKVILILSFMPVAMNALVPPALFSLDLHLANACWIFSTLALCLVLPTIFAIMRLL
ncbi:MAG: hypothetical protein K6F46_08510 [Desulfovibrio sp.]|nr:hypothetical protein [Desulfovibrio sp.]